MGQRTSGPGTDGSGPTYRQGNADGRRWARAASISELERLKNLQEAIHGDWPAWVAKPEAWQEMVSRIQGTSDHEQDRYVQFWSVIAGANWRRFASDPDYLRGFVEGALAEYDSETATLGHA